MPRFRRLDIVEVRWVDAVAVGEDLSFEEASNPTEGVRYTVGYFVAQRKGHTILAATADYIRDGKLYVCDTQNIPTALVQEIRLIRKAPNAKRPA